MAIDIRMKRPGEQYSIYKSHVPDAPAEKTPETAPAKPSQAPPQP